MPSFSQKSLDNLRSCDPRLQEIFEEVIKNYDCTILEGYRSEERQNQMLEEGKSTLAYPDSNHNEVPSKAVDAAPYPIDWDDLYRFIHFAGYVKAVADRLGYRIRWGGDWDMDGTIMKDQQFDDLPHFEILD